LKQSNIIYASQTCGWPNKPLNNLFDMLQADLTVVNDLPYFYSGVPLPDRFVLTGPLYSASGSDASLDPELQRVFVKRNPTQINLFCTMGSSAKKEFLMEAVKAITVLPADLYHAVILVPKAVCPIEEIRPLVTQNPNILITDRFVPAKLVNEKADVTICHGGQGTIQTALSCGCPVVGFAMQPEQQINLDHVVQSGAGLRIPATRWKKHNILAAVRKVTTIPAYRENAKKLGDEMGKVDSYQKTANAIWNFIKSKFDLVEGEEHAGQ
ncbi:MAG TPA: nucleotide disphospho-sugar-binding domain-containing protein, partial [Ruminiclostridium sp.]|nr:nucleotide disphospho-sugar-binding domain-containing protein [Ruminiclostridium sp.]